MLSPDRFSDCAQCNAPPLESTLTAKRDLVERKPSVPGALNCPASVLSPLHDSLIGSPIAGLSSEP